MIRDERLDQVPELVRSLLDDAGAPLIPQMNE